MHDLIWLIPALPLAGFVFLVAFGRRIGEPGAGWLATAAVAGSFATTVALYVSLLGQPAESRQYTQTLFTWLPVGGLKVDMGFLADPLSVTMCLFVTGIATLIHLYSIGYMHGDERFTKFFVYLNLFVFSMLMLVLGDNMLITFLGWEGVGACSYFLISFWHEDEANASAGKKAFVTNRIGDFGFMVAMFFTFGALGTLNYQGIVSASPSNPPSAVSRAPSSSASEACSARARNLASGERKSWASESVTARNSPTSCSMRSSIALSRSANRSKASRPPATVSTRLEKLPSPTASTTPAIRFSRRPT